jgi:hypothetical protein
MPALQGLLVKSELGTAWERRLPACPDMLDHYHRQPLPVALVGAP